MSTCPKADPGFCDGGTKQALTGEDRAEILDGSKIEEASPNSPLQLPNCPMEESACSLARLFFSTCR